MTVFEKTSEIKKSLELLSEQNQSIGFVPTMGALHSGHLELIKRARLENDIVVVSIFVNPAQFNNSSDLSNYPRTIEQDLSKLQDINCDLVFVPTVDEVYPDGIELLDLDIAHLESMMEGEFRPGHFRGMVTVVDYFFSVVKPHKAYFGEKDYQQLLIIKKLAQQKHNHIQIIACSTERDNNGLALSSRNMRLNADQYEVAIRIPMVLKRTASLVKEIGPFQAQIRMSEELKMIKGLNLDYLEIREAHALGLPTIGKEEELRVFVAAFVGPVRLIDNMAV